MFLAAKKHRAKHHVHHAFHHKLTTLLPSKKHEKIAKPPAKTTFPPSKPIEKLDPHAASEVVLPYPAPKT
jgi:hypothetical protein